MRRILAIAATLVAATAAAAHASTVSLHSHGDDPRAVNSDYDTASGTVTITGAVGQYTLSVTVTPNGSAPITIGYNASQPLALGTFAVNGAALEVTGLSGTCTKPTASVTLKAVVSTLFGFARVIRLNFDQTCQGATGALHGVVDLELPLAAELVNPRSEMAVGDGPDYAYTVLNGNGLPYLELRHNGGLKRLTPSGDAAYLGGMDGGRIVYQYTKIRHRRAVNSNIYLKRFSGLKSVPIPTVNTKDWEWHPDISGNRMIFMRNHVVSRKKTKWTLFLYNLKTHKHKTLAHGTDPNIVDAGAINGDYVVWHICKTKCTVYRYRISTGGTFHIGGGSYYYYEPAVTSDGTVYMYRSGLGCGSSVAVVRWVPGSTPVQLFTLPFYEDGGSTDTEEIAGTTYLFYAVENCSTREWQTFRAPVDVPGA
jgi:hypothetical protein